MTVIFSEEFVGAGVLAGAPFDCINSMNQSQAHIDVAFANCDTVKNKVNEDRIETFAKAESSANAIDDVSNLSGKPVWVYSGTLDQVVI